MSNEAAKRVYYLAIIAIVAVAAISAVIILGPSAAPGPSSQAPTRTLEVTGIGSVTTSPDEIDMVLGVQTQAPTAAKAATINDANVTRVLTALTNLGVPGNATKTVSYSLTPIYVPSRNQSRPPVIAGYRVTHAIQVKLTRLGAVGDVLDAAVKAGANQVQSVTFRLSDAKFEATKTQALQSAIQDGQAQAESIASTLKVKLTGPVEVKPLYVSPTPPETYLSAASGAAATSIQPGTLEVRVTVQLTYHFS